MRPFGITNLSGLAIKGKKKHRKLLERSGKTLEMQTHVVDEKIELKG